MLPDNRITISLDRLRQLKPSYRFQVDGDLSRRSIRPRGSASSHHESYYQVQQRCTNRWDLLRRMEHHAGGSWRERLRGGISASNESRRYMPLGTAPQTLNGSFSKTDRPNDIHMVGSAGFIPGRNADPVAVERRRCQQCKSEPEYSIH